jgi:hypothetical protein
MLLTKDNRLLEPVTWQTAGTLWLRDVNGGAWMMELASGNLTQAPGGQNVLPNGWH